jgi:hypothetical protein
MGGTPIMHKILEVLIQNKNQLVTLGQIQEETEIPSAKILAAINNFRRYNEEGTHLSVIQKGRVWRYSDIVSSNDQPEKSLFECIAHTKKGDLILQDEQGNLYRAIELE